MRIYFAGSIRGGRDDRELYLQIIEQLRQYGEVTTEHVGDPALEVQGEVAQSDRDIHDRDLAWLKSADVVVAEVTAPSLGVGYEIAKATEWNIPTLCLYRPSPHTNLSAMVAGCAQVTVFRYESITGVSQYFAEWLGEKATEVGASAYTTLRASEVTSDSSPEAAECHL